MHTWLQVKNSSGVLELPCDVLIPAALESQIHSGNAANIKAKVVAEAANGPVTPLAETILEANNVVILPDLLLNAVSFKIFFLVGSRCCVMSFCDIPFYCICLGVCKSEILA
jgi:hypothetical protein